MIRIQCRSNRQLIFPLINALLYAYLKTCVFIVLYRTIRISYETPFILISLNVYRVMVERSRKNKWPTNTDTIKINIEKNGYERRPIIMALDDKFEI